MQEGHTYRVAVDPQTGAHGYEVGYWPDGADLNDPAAFTVVARCFDQQEAAALASAHNADGGQARQGAAPGHLTRGELEAMHKDDLVREANERDLELPSHATKSDMIDALVRHQRTHR